ncbi:MAG: OmpH family outer membrane protein [Candidatus Marinimicrobia bacterium]|nr:OmpH family outer membrane protein [Candidatus Neomarinimicrobiota bacterium]
MKKLSIVLIAGLVLMTGLVSKVAAEQKIGFVNSDRILAEYKEAQEAQSKLDVEAKKLQDEYQMMILKLDSLRQSYEQQKMLMSESRRKEKEDEIIKLQQNIQVFQQQKLGPQGEIYQKQNEIVGPVLEKVKNIIKEVAEEKNYDFIFDTVAGNILYAEPVHDMTDDVIYKLERLSSQSSETKTGSN